MTTEQERAFEQILHSIQQAQVPGNDWRRELKLIESTCRAVLQSQVKNDTTLFCDLKTDEEKNAFFLTKHRYETGMIAQAIQNNMAMAYHRCSEYRKELEALQSQDREDAEVARLQAVAQAVADALTMYERYGEVCPFEGEPMIHASILVDLGELAREAIDHFTMRGFTAAYAVLQPK